jgi:hypothetical protein
MNDFFRAFVVGVRETPAGFIAPLVGVARLLRRAWMKGAA